MARCPFHKYGQETTPSLAIYEDHYHCYGCGAHGPLDGLPGYLASIAEPRILVERLEGAHEDIGSYVVEAHRRFLDLQQQVGLYLQRRGVFGLAHACSLGYDKGWLVVPIKDRDRKARGYIKRAYPQLAKKTGLRYLIPAGQEAMIYVPSWSLWDAAEVSYITFGIIDAMSLVVAGLAAATPTNGKASFDPKWVDDVRHKIVVVPDKGEERDAHELASQLDWRGSVASIDWPNDCGDPNDILVRHGPDRLKEVLNAA